MAVSIDLPASIGTKRDVISLQRELEQIRDDRIQNRMAEQSAGVHRDVAHASKRLQQFMTHNQLELNDQNIKELIPQLDEIRHNSQMLHISFANEPDAESLAKVVSWFRREVQPNLLLQVGVQPTIAGGCVVQTAKHRYDFSLRRNILASAPKFTEALRTATGREVVAQQQVAQSAGAEG